MSSVKKLLWGGGSLLLLALGMAPLIFYLALPSTCPDPPKTDLRDGVYKPVSAEIPQRYRPMEPYGQATERRIRVDRQRERVIVEFTDAKGRRVEQVWRIESVERSSER